ncbi:MAG: hypothetical protein J6W03_06050 [Bacteroidaceae bacterium]|nr:hypothetical protein [Bacteroidaceae bacterium]
MKLPKWISTLRASAREQLYRTLTRISPRLNTMIQFRKRKGYRLNLDNPQTLDEKIQKLKLESYETDPLIIQCADKYAVRSYVEKQGCSDILVPLIAAYDKVEDIEWDKLPNAFAMKWNFGSGTNIICPDKSKLDIEEAKRKMKKWRKEKNWYLYLSEMQYKSIPPKIVVEAYLKPEHGVQPDDYKLYCFNGEPKFILLCTGREFGRPKFYFFDEGWNLARINRDSKAAPEGFTYPRPNCFDKLMESARTLSAPFKFVRADFYVVGDKVYFGELTFTPEAGIDAHRLYETDLMFGKLLKL